MKNKINEVGKDVIELQIKALRKLKNSINNSFENAVRAIMRCKSKVIICGVGKSGIIASKISATLSSVGTPSFSISASSNFTYSASSSVVTCLFFFFPSLLSIISRRNK